MSEMVLTSQHLPLRLAYVEDVEADYRALLDSWRAHGFTNPIDWYRSGEAFVHELAGPFPRVPDLALVDLTLSQGGGQLSGLETMQIVRANPQIAQLPLFIVTASDLETADSIARLVRAAHRCKKPLRAPNLLEMLIDINRRRPKFGLELVRLPDAPDVPDGLSASPG